MRQKFQLQDYNVCRGQKGFFELAGFFAENVMEGCQFRAFLNRRELPVTVAVREGRAPYEKYLFFAQDGQYIDREYCLRVALPKRLPPFGALRVYERRESEQALLFSISVFFLRLHWQPREGSLCWKVEKRLKRRKIGRFYEPSSRLPEGAQPPGLQEPIYNVWREKRAASPETLRAQRGCRMAWQPLVSIVVPLYRTKEAFLRELVASIQAQTYENWELCLSDGSGSDSPLRDVLAGLREAEPRIRVAESEAPLGISENTNAALEIARGEFVAFADHDDLLEPNALYECVRALNEQPETDLLYTDEDKVNMDGTEFFQPHFKPDYNLELLRSVNYFCHLMVVKRELLERAGRLDPLFDGAQDYDLALRLTESASCIRHVPGALYHWRAHQESTAEDPGSKAYAFAAGQRALEAHYQRHGISARVEQGDWPGLYRARFETTALRSAVSTVPVREDGADTAALNERARKADGKYLLFLDERMDAAKDGVMEELLALAAQEGVGAVGGLVRYASDGTVCAAGLILGRDGRIWHAFEGRDRSDPGYLARIYARMDVSALPVSCVLVRRSVFEQLGGFDAELPCMYAAADFCLRLRGAGLRAVYTPYAQMTIRAPRYREYELSVGEAGRKRFFARWEEVLAGGDPNYNRNFDERGGNYALWKG